MSAARRLIVSADDFGLGAAVDAGVLAAVAAGGVTSVGVMGNLAAPSRVAALAAVRPGLSVGVHLNLTTGRPLRDDVPSLVDARGDFHSLATLGRRALARRIDAAEVARELGAQIERVRAAGVTVDHLDSHEHVHLLPGVFGVVRRLARADGLALRTHRPLLLAPPGANGRVAYYRRHPRRIATHLAKRLFALRLRLAGVSTPDGMVASSLLTDPVPGGARAEWAAIARALPPGTWELVVHPADLGVSGDPNETAWLGDLVERRAEELDALCAPDFLAMLADAGVTLVSFAALREPVARRAVAEERYA